MGGKKELTAKDAEEKLPALTARERRFVEHYSVHCNGSAAVRHAEYESVAPAAYAHDLLTKPYIQQHVTHARKKLGEIRYDIVDQTIAQLRAMARADPTEMLDGEGNLKDPREWPDDCKYLLTGLEIEERMSGTGDAAEMVRTKKVRLESRKGVLDSIAKITGNWEKNAPVTVVVNEAEQMPMLEVARRLAYILQSADRALPVTVENEA